jgi:hypothetical protein
LKNKLIKLYLENSPFVNAVSDIPGITEWSLTMIVEMLKGNNEFRCVKFCATKTYFIAGREMLVKKNTLLSTHVKGASPGVLHPLKSFCKINKLNK